MSKYQFRVLAAGIGILILLMLWTVLPPSGWAVLALVVISYGLCWVVERAIRKAWSRR